MHPQHTRSALQGIALSEFNSIGHSRLTELIYAGNKSFIIPQILTFIWIASEFIVLNFNSKRRALHDFIAGTVVLEDTKKQNR